MILSANFNCSSRFALFYLYSIPCVCTHEHTTVSAHVLLKMFKLMFKMAFRLAHCHVTLPVCSFCMQHFHRMKTRTLSGSNVSTLRSCSFMHNALQSLHFIYYIAIYVLYSWVCIASVFMCVYVCVCFCVVHVCVCVLCGACVRVCFVWCMCACVCVCLYVHVPI